MRKLLIAIVVVAALFATVVGGASAGSGNPSGTGQPNASCQAEPSQPGGQVPGSNPGSPFAVGVSDSHYAGSQPQNSKNPKSVSQYDVACYHVSLNH